MSFFKKTTVALCPVHVKRGGWDFITVAISFFKFFEFQAVNTTYGHQMSVSIIGIYYDTYCHLKVKFGIDLLMADHINGLFKWKPFKGFP